MKYNLIYADCPWLYDDARTEKSTGMALSAYPCMPTADICALPVPGIAEKNCMLLCWATLPKLPEALEVIKAWGFKYVTTAFVWVKMRPRWEGPEVCEGDVYSGLGHYTNANVELVLLGRKGNSWRKDRNVKQVLIAPRGEHSAKPPEIRDRAERLFGDVPRVELFARERAHGWDALGSFVDGRDITESLLLTAAQERRDE